MIVTYASVGGQVSFKRSKPMSPQDMLTVRLGKVPRPTIPILRRANTAAWDFRRLLVDPERRLERVHAVVRGLHGWDIRNW